MCDACEDYDGTPLPSRDEATMREARAIEATIPGERVPEEAWAIFSGLAGGSIQWKHYQRLHVSYEAAANNAPVPELAGHA